DHIRGSPNKGLKGQVFWEENIISLMQRNQLPDVSEIGHTLFGEESKVFFLKSSHIIRDFNTFGSSRKNEKIDTTRDLRQEVRPKGGSTQQTILEPTNNIQPITWDFLVLSKTPEPLCSA
ncbi:MAG: hypothetical protein AAF399_30855, partial [Bacteroidota bacterium]